LVIISSFLPFNPEGKHVHRNADSNPVCGDAMHVCVIDLEPKPPERWKPALEEADSMFGPDAEF
jgi:hypothetical protein